MKVTKYMKKVAAILLCICLVATISMPASAASITRTLSGNSQHARVIRVTTYETTAKVVPITSTQTLHTKGYTTVIGVSSSVTKTCTAESTISAAVGAEFGPIAMEMSSSLGVGYSAALTVGTNVSYTVGSGTASGKYRIEVVFPRKNTNYYVYDTAASGFTTIVDETIKAMPCPNDAYHKLSRYANP